jgi:hypothetical protein
LKVLLIKSFFSIFGKEFKRPWNYFLKCAVQILSIMSDLRHHATQLLDLMASVAYKDMIVSKRWFAFLMARILRNGDTVMQMRHLMHSADGLGRHYTLYAWQMLLVRVMAVANMLSVLEKALNLDHICTLAAYLPQDRRRAFMQACSWLQCQPLDMHSDVPWAVTNHPLPALFSPLYQMGVAPDAHADQYELNMAVHAALVLYMGCIKALFFPWKDVELLLGEDASVALLRFDDRVVSFIATIAVDLHVLHNMFPDDIRVKQAFDFAQLHRLETLPLRHIDYATVHAESKKSGQYGLDIVAIARREITSLHFYHSVRFMPLMAFMVMPWKTPYDAYAPSSLHALLKSAAYQAFLLNIMVVIACCLVTPMHDAMRWYRELFMPAFDVSLGQDWDYFMVDRDQLDVWVACHVNDWSPPLTTGAFAITMPPLRYMFVS